MNTSQVTNACRVYHSKSACPNTGDTKLLLRGPFGLSSDILPAGSPRMLAEFARSACCFSIPVFGVTGVTVIWLQTCSHHRGESGLDLSPFIICQTTISTSQFDLATSKPQVSCCIVCQSVRMCRLHITNKAEWRHKSPEGRYTPKEIKGFTLLSDWVSLRWR